MGIDLSVVIVNWNTKDYLRQCLVSVYASVNGLDFETWVVDNGSTDDSARMVREAYPQARLIENGENAGFARANNQALQACSGRYALLLNSDAFLQAGAVERLVKALEADPRAGIAGPRLVYPDGRAQRAHGRLPTLGSEVVSLLGWDKLAWAGRLSSDQNGARETGVVSGACLLARKAMLDEIGLLDERFFMYSEEVDLCARAQAAGWKVLHVPAAQAVHVGGGSGGLTAKRILELYQAKQQYFGKHHGEAAAQRLGWAMRLASRLKAACYSLCDRQKARLWGEVEKELK